MKIFGILIKPAIIESIEFSSLGGTVAAIGHFFRNVFMQNPERDLHDVMMAFFTGAAGALAVWIVKVSIAKITKKESK